MRQNGGVRETTHHYTILPSVSTLDQVLLQFLCLATDTALSEYLMKSLISVLFKVVLDLERPAFD